MMTFANIINSQDYELFKREYNKQSPFSSFRDDMFKQSVSDEKYIYYGFTGGCMRLHRDTLLLETQGSYPAPAYKDVWYKV